MVGGVRCLIIKCSKSSTNSVANACNSEQLILVVQDLGGEGGNSKCQNTTLSFQPPPDLYALPADKTATQHIAKSHHSWQHQPQREYIARYILPNILPDIASSGNVLLRSSSYLFSNCETHSCHHSLCASLPSKCTIPCFAICRLFDHFILT